MLRLYRISKSREESILDAACAAYLNNDKPTVCRLHPDDDDALKEELGVSPGERMAGTPLRMYAPHGVMRIEKDPTLEPGTLSLE